MRITGVAVAAALVLGACGGEATTDEQVAQLKTELAQANDRIAELERDLERTETTEPAEVDETTTTTEKARSLEAGTRDNPYPLGAEALLDEWNVSVLRVNMNANAEVAAENPYNDPPAEGSTYVLVRIRATYTGPSEGTAWVDLSAEIIGDDQRRYGEASCVEPDSIGDQPSVLTGGTVEGNVCLAVPVGLGSPLVVISESLSFDDDEVWFAIA